MKGFEPDRLLMMFEKGYITETELILFLVQSATEMAPERIVEVLPPGWLAKIRERSAVPPESPDQCRVFGSVRASETFDADQSFREVSRRFHDGLWRWHRYFAENDF